MFLASLALYVACLALPAYVTVEGGSSQAHLGLEALVLGPLGILNGHFSWLANPFLWGAWITRTRSGDTPSFMLALLAIPVAALFALGDKIAVGSAGEYLYHAAAGYYLWLGSILAAGAAAFFYRDIGDLVENRDAAP